MSWLKKFKDFFSKEKYVEVYVARGTWNINYTDAPNLKDTKYSNYTILQSDKGRYKLDINGYQPKNHHLYDEIFKLYRGLCDGIYEIKGGIVLKKEPRYEDLSIEECNIRLQKAVDDENYELAEKIREIISKKSL